MGCIGCEAAEDKNAREAGGAPRAEVGERLTAGNGVRRWPWLYQPFA